MKSGIPKGLNACGTYYSVTVWSKDVLTRRKHPLIDQLPNDLQGEDMKSGIPKGLNACGTYYSVTMCGLKTC